VIKIVKTFLKNIINENYKMVISFMVPSLIMFKKTYVDIL